MLSQLSIILYNTRQIFCVKSIDKLYLFNTYKILHYRLRLTKYIHKNIFKISERNMKKKIMDESLFAPLSFLPICNLYLSPLIRNSLQYIVFVFFFTTPNPHTTFRVLGSISIFHQNCESFAIMQNFKLKY